MVMIQALLLFLIFQSFVVSYIHRVVVRKGSSLRAKSKEEVFFCESCGTEHIKWMGRCASCKEWNTVKHFRAARMTSTSLDPRASFGSATSSSLSPTKPGTKDTEKGKYQSNRWVLSGSISEGSLITPMSSITDSVSFDRIPLFSEELNRVLGGGLVKGSVILMAGEPGVGKSTLLLQLAASSGHRVVYISGEENPQQIVLRARRLTLPQENIFLVCDVDIDKALQSIGTLGELPTMVIVDSIQTMRTAESQHTLGSVSQIKDSTAKIIQFAKSTGVAVVLVGHVTKTGDVAGPRVLEHMVDTVLCIEGSEKTDYRMLRCDKNRFGSVSEVGVFMMTEAGMQDVTNPSELFLTQKVLTESQEGSAVVIVMEGSRPILAEIQCLVSTTYAGANAKVNAKRTSDGFPIQRMLLICAVIEKRLKLSMWSRDVYLNVVGGLRLQEPSADLAVAVAIVSSYFGVPIKPATAFIGEIGLGGELRGGKRIEQRITEAIKLGFTTIIVPKNAGYNANKNRHVAVKAQTSTGVNSVEVNKIETGREVNTVNCENLYSALVAGLDHVDVPGLLAKKDRRKSRSNTNETGNQQSTIRGADHMSIGQRYQNALTGRFTEEEEDDENAYAEDINEEDLE